MTVVKSRKSLLHSHTGKFVFRTPKILRRNIHQNISRQKSPSSETNVHQIRLAETQGKH
jgi:hypothetical protein